MQLNTGTPSLISYTRDLAGDPASAASEIWTDARVKAAINDAYLELREVARQLGDGPEVKRGYATSVANQLWYQLPADFKRMLLVEVDNEGRDLSSDANAEPIILRPLALDTALAGYEAGDFTELEYVAMADGHFAVVVPPTSGGSNGIRITYEAETALLSGDTDEPSLPEPYQNLICYKAAVQLRASENLAHEDLMRLMLLKENQFRIAMQERLMDNEGQVAVAGLIEQDHLTRFGTISETS